MVILEAFPRFSTQYCSYLGASSAAILPLLTLLSFVASYGSMVEGL